MIHSPPHRIQTKNEIKTGVRRELRESLEARHKEAHRRIVLMHRRARAVEGRNIVAENVSLAAANPKPCGAHRARRCAARKKERKKERHM
jgi:hypothetical protein